jgi:hypothetical protein
MLPNCLSGNDVRVARESRAETGNEVRVARECGVEIHEPRLISPNGDVLQVNRFQT